MDGFMPSLFFRLERFFRITQAVLNGHKYNNAKRKKAMTAISYTELLPDSLGKTFQAKSPSLTIHPRGTLVSLLGERDGDTWIDRTDSQTLYSFVGVVDDYNADTEQYLIIREGACFISGIEDVTIPTRLYLEVDGTVSTNRNGSGIRIGSATGQLTGQPAVNADLTGIISTVTHADYNRADEALRQRINLDLVELEDSLNEGVESVRQQAQGAQETAEAANANAETRLLEAEFEAFQTQLASSLSNMNTSIAQHTDQLRNLTARIAFLEDTKIGELTLDASVDSGHRKVYVSGELVDIPEENPVRFLVTDSLGNSATQDIAHDGANYNGEVSIADLAPGAITIQAQAEDRYRFEGDTTGNIVTINVSDTFENIRGTVTIDTITINQGYRKVAGLGTCVDIPNGTAQVTIKDKNNKEVTGTGTINNNTWSFDDVDISPLAFGDVTVTVGLLDIWNFIISASVTRQFEFYSGTLTMNVEHDTLTGPVLDVNGTASETLEDSPVVITAWNTDNASVTVTGGTSIDSEGNYLLSDLNIFDLAYGTIRVKAVAVDRFGNDIERLGAVNYEYVELPVSVIMKRGQNPHHADIVVTKDNDLGEYQLELLANSGTVLETVQMQADELNHTFDLTAYGPGNYRVRLRVVDPYQRTIETTGLYTYVIPPQLTVKTISSDDPARKITLALAINYIPSGARLYTSVTTGEDTNWASNKEFSLSQGFEQDKVITVDAHPSEAGRHNVLLRIVDAAGDLLMLDVNEQITVNDVSGEVTDVLCNDNDVAKTVIVSAKIRNKKPGTPITLLLTGANGATINRSEGMDFEATSPVTFAFSSVSVASMPYGNITAAISYIDLYGDVKTGSSNFVLDNLEGNFNSVNFSVDSANSRASMSGSVERVATGASISYSLVDRNGKRVNGNVSVGSTGSFSASNVSIGTLAYGSIRLELSVVDLGGTTRTASRTGTFTQPGSLTPSVSINDAAKTIAVSVAKARIASNISVVLRDSQGRTQSHTINNSSSGTVSGTFSISGLAYGNVTCTVSATDNNGSTISATASDRYDAVNGTIGITGGSFNVDGAIPAVTGTTTNIPSGTVVTVELYKNSIHGNNHVETVTTTVRSNGSWSATGLNAAAYQFDRYWVKAYVRDLTNTTRSTEYQMQYSDIRPNISSVELAAVDETRMRVTVRLTNRSGSHPITATLEHREHGREVTTTHNANSNTYSFYVSPPTRMSDDYRVTVKMAIPGGERTKVSNWARHRSAIRLVNVTGIQKEYDQVVPFRGTLTLYVEGTDIRNGHGNVTGKIVGSTEDSGIVRTATYKRLVAGQIVRHVFEIPIEHPLTDTSDFDVEITQTKDGITKTSTVRFDGDAEAGNALDRSSGSSFDMQFRIMRGVGNYNTTRIGMLITSMSVIYREREPGIPDEEITVDLGRGLFHNLDTYTANGGGSSGVWRDIRHIESIYNVARYSDFVDLNTGEEGTLRELVPAYGVSLSILGTVRYRAAAIVTNNRHIEVVAREGDTTSIIYNSPDLN